MTTIETTPLPGLGLLGRLGKALSEHRRRRASHRLMAQLSFYDAHLLRDIGISPADVERGLQGRNMSLLFDPLPRNDRT